MFTWLKTRSFDPLTQVAAYNQLGEEQDVPEGNQVQIKVKNASRYYVYAPVSYVRMINGSVKEEKDSSAEVKSSTLSDISYSDILEFQNWKKNVD